jgi:hypothetical protein
VVQYLVLGHSGDGARLALRDGAGCHHLARALNVPPPTGTTLNGTTPRMGFGLLVCGTTGQIYRVIFETINSTDARVDARQQAPST